ncbi:MAG: hypothetical protein ABIU63_00500 [Chitinophagaceae bacterium]
MKTFVSLQSLLVGGNTTQLQKLVISADTVRRQLACNILAEAYRQS